MKSLGFRWKECPALGLGGAAFSGADRPPLPQCMRQSACTCSPSDRPPSSSMRTWCTSSWALPVRLLSLPRPPTSYQLLFLPPDLGIDHATLPHIGWIPLSKSLNLLEP